MRSIGNVWKWKFLEDIESNGTEEQANRENETPIQNKNKRKHKLKPNLKLIIDIGGNTVCRNIHVGEAEKWVNGYS
jgi:hypothetical protein